MARYESESRRIKCHTFVMTKGDGGQVHGVCLIFYERITDPQVLQAMKVLQQMFVRFDSRTRIRHTIESLYISPAHNIVPPLSPPP
jgi:hypothetical protein